MKSIHQISISELCRQAGINRSTFYQHFGSQYDLLAEMTDSFLEELEQKLQNVSPNGQAGIQSRVELCFKYAAENAELTLLLINNNNGTEFAKRLFSLPRIEDLLNEKLFSVNNAVERKAIISFVTYGSYQLLIELLNTPNRASAEDEAALILGLARKVC